MDEEKSEEKSPGERIYKQDLQDDRNCHGRIKESVEKNDGERDQSIHGTAWPQPAVYKLSPTSSTTSAALDSRFRGNS